MQLQQGAVELVGLRHHGRGVAHEHVGAVVPGNPAEEGRAAGTAFGQDVGYHGRGRGLAVGAGDREACLAAGELSEHARALHDLVALLARVCELAEVVGDGRSVDHEGVLPVFGNHGAVVMVMHGNALCFKLPRELGGRAVVARDAAALEFAETGYRAHAYAAYSYEVYVAVSHLAIL